MKELLQCLIISVVFQQISLESMRKLCTVSHCHSHQLNLVVVSSCSIQCVRNAFDQIKELSFILNFSEPRQ